MVVNNSEPATERYQESLQQGNYELALLNRVSRAFSSTLDLDEVLEIVLEETRRLLNVITASLWLIDPETGELVCRQAKGSGNEIVRGWRLSPGQGLVGWVAENGQSLIIPDARVDERHFKEIDQETGLMLCSILSMPLRIKGEVIGVLNLADTTVGRFTPEDLTLLEPVVTAAAIAIENARLHTAVQTELAERQRAETALRQLNEELEQRVEERTQELQNEIIERKRAETELKRSHEELITLNAIATMISQSRDLGKIFATILDSVLVIVEAPAGYIQLFDEDTGGLSLVAQSGFSKKTVTAMKAAQLSYAPTKSKQSDALGITPANQLLEIVKQRGWQHLVRVPLTSKETTLGHIEIFSQEFRELDPQQIRLLNAIGRQVGMAIENERLSKEAAEIRVIQELDHLRSELIGNVSHELRTPVGLIKAASTTLLAKDVEFDRETQELLLRGIDEETDRLEHIVNNLLDLSRLEQKRLTLELSTTDMSQLICNIIELMQPHMPSNLKMSHNFSNQSLVVNVDATRIEQVLRNLVTNAVKYSPDGGTINIKGWQDKQELFIQVNDQGMGIPAADVNKIFERFYRVENEITQKVSGVGLGLTISREIVEAHGGRMWVESESGVGSTFYFTLPIGTDTDEA